MSLPEPGELPVQTRFMLCSERPPRGLAALLTSSMLQGGSGLESAAYASAAGLVRALSDEAAERAMMARYGL